MGGVYWGKFLRLSSTPMIDGRIFKVVKEVSQNLGRSWSVAQMADIIEMSESNFRKLFKKEMKTTPYSWLRNRRLQKAAEMLSDADCFLPIKVIAFTVGIPNESTFDHEFRRTFGITPSECRHLAWEKDQENSKTTTSDRFQEDMIVFDKE